MNKEEVKERIHVLGLKKSFIAKKIGISNVMFSYYLSDKKNISAEKENILKGFLGL